MQTQFMSEVGDNPWLEYLPSDGGPPRQIELSKFPFTIGRDECTDFRVDSLRVSREHATIVQEEGALVLKDLGSTNGTAVNGRMIFESPLNDGDTLLIADFQMTFRVPLGKGKVTRVTQVIATPLTGDSASGSHGHTWTDLVRDVRRLREMVNTGCGVARFEPIKSLATAEVFGYHVDSIMTTDHQVMANRALLKTECRLMQRARLVHRIVAAEQASLLSCPCHIFFGFDVFEVGIDWLPETLTRLRRAVTERHRVVASIPESAVCDIPYFRDLISKLRDLNVAVAYQGFAEGQTQTIKQRALSPDFITLSPALVRGIHRNGDAQRQLQSMIQLADEIGCQIVASRVDDSDSHKVVTDLGCHFAQGTMIGPPQSMDCLLDEALCAV